MKNIHNFSFIALLLAGCGDPDMLDVGNEKIGQNLSDYAAEWDGYAQAFSFAGDGTDRVSLTIDANGEGKIRFGEEALFGPATDADALYPPTYPEYPEVELEMLRRVAARSGFEYSVNAAHVDDARLRFEFNAGQYMESWCALQADSPLPGWGCGLGTTTGWSASEEGEEVVCSYHDESIEFYPISCHRAAQCSLCICEGDECQATNHRVAHFDAALSSDGQSLTGTLLLPSGERITVVLSQ